MNFPPLLGNSRDKISAISVDGVMGYPAKKRQPAARAPNPMASFPWISLMLKGFLLIESQTPDDDSQVWTMGITKVTTSAFFGGHYNWDVFFVIKRQYFGWTELHTNVASLTPVRINKYFTTRTFLNGMSRRIRMGQLFFKSHKIPLQQRIPVWKLGILYFQPGKNQSDIQACKDSKYYLRCMVIILRQPSKFRRVENHRIHLL
jgi:hypothetical protein